MKITNISEPANESELQQVKDAKDFSRSLIGLVATVAVGYVGAAAWQSNVGADFSTIPFVLGMFTHVVSHGILMPNLIVHLIKLYNKKGNDQQITTNISESEERNDMDVSGGMKR